MTPAQLTTLKAAILAETDPVFAVYRTNGQTDLMAAWLSEAAVPAFIVWRTNLTRAQVYHEISPEGTSWNWTTYKNQGVAEQNAWVQMFMGDSANMALPNLRAGVSAIFTGSAQANAQSAHVLAAGKRSASRVEKLFATGTGTTLAPATMTFEGSISGNDISAALSA